MAREMADQLTRNFWRSEFACKCGCGFDAIRLTLVGVLQLCRDMIGKPITVTSGCRCPDRNAEAGGEPNSYHVTAEAIDFTTASSFDLALIANRLNRWGGGFHFYQDRKFIHIDDGPFRRWEG